MNVKNGASDICLSYHSRMRNGVEVINEKAGESLPFRNSVASRNKSGGLDFRFTGVTSFINLRG